MDEPKVPFATVFTENKTKIFHLVYRLLGDSSEAEDVTQEVFFRAHRNYTKFRQEAEIYSWLYRIAINLCREKIRFKQRQRKYFTDPQRRGGGTEDKDENSDVITDRTVPRIGEDPFTVLVNREIQFIVRREINTLPAKYSVVIILKEIENMSYTEISRILNISIDVIGVRLIRARQMLKKKLKYML